MINNLSYCLIDPESLQTSSETDGKYVMFCVRVQDFHTLDKNQ